MRIGELANLAEVTPRTIRYYESLGLMPARQGEGQDQHHYDDVAVLRLRKINQLKKIGLSLEEIGSVIDLYFIDPTGRHPKVKVLAILRQHLQELDHKADELAQLRAVLVGHIERFSHWLEQFEQSDNKEESHHE